MKHLTVLVDGGVPHVAEIRSYPELDLATVTLYCGNAVPRIFSSTRNCPPMGGTNSKSHRLQAAMPFIPLFNTGRPLLLLPIRDDRCKSPDRKVLDLSAWATRATFALEMAMTHFYFGLN